MDSRNSNGFESRNFYFTTVWKLFFKNFNQKWKHASKKSFYTFEDIDLRESHVKLQKKPSETLRAD